MRTARATALLLLLALAWPCMAAAQIPLEETAPPKKPAAQVQQLAPDLPAVPPAAPGATQPKAPAAPGAAATAPGAAAKPEGKGPPKGPTRPSASKPEDCKPLYEAACREAKLCVWVAEAKNPDGSAAAPHCLPKGAGAAAVKPAAGAAACDGLYEAGCRETAGCTWIAAGKNADGSEAAAKCQKKAPTTAKPKPKPVAAQPAAGAPPAAEAAKPAAPKPDEPKPAPAAAAAAAPAPAEPAAESIPSPPADDPFSTEAQPKP